MDITEIILLIFCLITFLILVTVISLIIMLLYKFTKNCKTADSNQGESISNQFNKISSDNLTEIWSLYYIQQNKLLNEIVPVVDILLKGSNRVKINKMLKNAMKNEGQTANKESTVSDRTGVIENSSLILDYNGIPNDIKIIWDSFVEHQNELLEQFKIVFDDAEHYFQRIIKAINSNPNYENQFNDIYAQIERYKWTSAGLSQVFAISNQLIKCRDNEEYYKLSLKLARILDIYRKKIKY